MSSTTAPGRSRLGVVTQPLVSNGGGHVNVPQVTVYEDPIVAQAGARQGQATLHQSHSSLPHQHHQILQQQHHHQHHVQLHPHNQLLQQYQQEQHVQLVQPYASEHTGDYNHSFAGSGEVQVPSEVLRTQPLAKVGQIQAAPRPALMDISNQRPHGSAVAPGDMGGVSGVTKPQLASNHVPGMPVAFTAGPPNWKAQGSLVRKPTPILPLPHGAGSLQATSLPPKSSGPAASNPAPLSSTASTLSGAVNPSALRQPLLPPLVTSSNPGIRQAMIRKQNQQNSILQAIDGFETEGRSLAPVSRNGANQEDQLYMTEPYELNAEKEESHFQTRSDSDELHSRKRSYAQAKDIADNVSKMVIRETAGLRSAEKRKANHNVSKLGEDSSPSSAVPIAYHHQSNLNQQTHATNLEGSVNVLTGNSADAADIKSHIVQAQSHSYIQQNRRNVSQASAESEAPSSLLAGAQNRRGSASETNGSIASAVAGSSSTVASISSSSRSSSTQSQTLRKSTLNGVKSPGFETYSTFHMRTGQDPAHEYEDDIHTSLLELESIYSPRPDYMQSVQNDITHGMRSILVDWLVEVADEYKLGPQTLYLAVQYVDRLLSVVAINRTKLQLVGVTAILVAAKYEEIYSPTIDQLVYISDNTYQRHEVLHMETILLTTLGFGLSVPTAYDFCSRYCRAGSLRGLGLYLALYISEVALQDAVYVDHKPSAIAATAVLLARYMLLTHHLLNDALPAAAQTLDLNMAPQLPLQVIVGYLRAAWPPALVSLTQFTASTLASCVSSVANVLTQVMGWTTGPNPNRDAQRAVTVKYTSPKFESVATRFFPPLDVTAFAMKCVDFPELMNSHQKSGANASGAGVATNDTSSQSNDAAIDAAKMSPTSASTSASASAPCALSAPIDSIDQQQQRQEDGSRCDSVNTIPTVGQ